MYSMYSMIAWLYHIGGGRRTYTSAVFRFFFGSKIIYIDSSCCTLFSDGQVRLLLMYQTNLELKRELDPVSSQVSYCPYRTMSPIWHQERFV